MSRRASCAARSVPTPQSDLTDAASGEVLFSGDDIGRTIQTVQRGFNGKWQATQISITTISGRQLKRTGMGYQPMPELTLSRPALVWKSPRSYSSTAKGTIIGP